MNTLILTEGELTPFCSKSHVVYLCNLCEEGKRLNIDFSYFPKVLDDREKSRELILEGVERFVKEDKDRYLRSWELFLPVQNILTVSIDDCKGFRGCAHRHCYEQHLFISRQTASPGFIPGAIIEGQWKVTISVHAVVTKTCRYKLHIWEGDNQNDCMDSI